MPVKCTKCNKKRASHGYKNIKGVTHCSKCKLENQVNKNSKWCLYNDCVKSAYFGINEPIRCAEHKQDNHIDLRVLRCQEKDCDQKALYTKVDEKKPTKCKNHKTNDMIKKKDNKKKQIRYFCKFQDCQQNAYWGINSRDFCQKHKQDNHIKIDKKTCIIQNCNKTPYYNLKGQSPQYCIDHKQSNMCNVREQYCIYEDCQQFAYYNYKDQKPQYCKNHLIDDQMINVKQKQKKQYICQQNDCQKNMFYMKNNIIYCKFHGKDICSKQDIKGITICEFGNCLKNAHYGIDKRLSCAQHKKNNYILLETKCQQENCNSTRLVYGYLRTKNTHCNKHKQPGQLKNPKKKCTEKNCNHLATHGDEKERTKCFLHMQKHMRNYLEKECINCKTYDILLDDNKCYPCSNEKFYKERWEIQVKSMINDCYLKEHLISHDKKLTNESECIKYRPDFTFYNKNTKTFIILEVDENQHKQYNEECDCTRMININEALGSQVLFIRFNPDKYKMNNETRNPSLSQRWSNLHLSLNKAIFTKEKLDGLLNIQQLYYDNSDDLYHKIR